MIVVVEGVSAAGKTAWASRFAPAVIDEITGQPLDSNDVAAAARYWADRHCERWQIGLELECNHEAVCFDTDPLKIHYSWCLWQIGINSREAWLANALATRERIAQKQLGFADLIVLLEPAEDVVRQQKLNDTTRRRGNFEMHLRLAAPLRRWYTLLENLSPNRVFFNAQQVQELPTMKMRADRYSLELFDSLINAANHPQSMT